LEPDHLYVTFCNYISCGALQNVTNLKYGVTICNSTHKLASEKRKSYVKWRLGVSLPPLGWLTRKCFYPSVISFEFIAFFSGAVITIKQQMKGHHCFLIAAGFLRA
jgi:hypothetical protein